MPSPSIITIEHDDATRIYKTKSRTSSGGSGSTRSHPSNGSRSSAFTSEESWDDLGDEIEPSDSASRSRHPPTRRYSEVRPAPTRRHSSHRILEDPEEEPPRRHQSSRRRHTARTRRADSHLTPSSDESSLGNVAYPDDYPPQGHHGMPPPRGYHHPSGYRHVPAPGHGGYPPSIVTSGAGYPDGYGTRQALVHMPQQQDPYATYQQPNPFSPQEQQPNPFSPMSAASGNSYFNINPHAPQAPQEFRPPPSQRPQSVYSPSSYHGSEMMSPYGHPGMGPFPGYQMPPMPGYPGYPMPGWYPPSNHSSPAPREDNKKDEEKKSREYEMIEAMWKKTEAARDAMEKERIAEREAAAAAAAEKKAKEEEEKKKKEEIADATKKAKEAAEKKAEEASKKAKEEHEKKVKELELAKADAEKKRKELEEQNAKLKPPEHAGKSIKFKDAMGRKFSFPYHLCKPWKGMEGLIKQAFIQVDILGDHVRQGHYDLSGPDGEIILPMVWETTIQPDWEIEMHMWPGCTGEEKGRSKGKGHDREVDELMDPLSNLGLGDLGMLGISDPSGRRKPSKKDVGAKRKSTHGHANIMSIGPNDPLPPPAHFPPSVLPDPLGMTFNTSGIEIVKDKSSKSSKPKRPQQRGFGAWMTGTSAPAKSSKKDDEKLDRVRSHRSSHSSNNSSLRSGGRRESVRSSSISTSNTNRAVRASVKRNDERVVAGCAVM